MSIERIFLAVLLANLIGFGGLSSLPVLRGQLLSAGLEADTLILHSLAVANISPGPNGLYLVVIGYFVAGLKGAAAAVLALLAPPVLVLLLERVRSRLVHLHRFRAALHSLSIAVISLLAVSSGSLAIHASTDLVGVLMVVVGTVLLMYGVTPIIAIAVAVVAGFVFP
jgi:chromate transporter